MMLLGLLLELHGCIMLHTIAKIGAYMKRLIVKLGFHGIRHRIRSSKLIEWMKNNGIGVSE